MGFKVPYQSIEGVPDNTRQQLYRNFEEIQKVLDGALAGGTTQWNGQVIFNSSTVDNVIIRGSGGTLRLDDRDGSGDWWAIYHNANVLGFWKLSDRFRFFEDHQITMGSARVGQHPVHTGYASLAYVNNVGSGNYGFLTNGVESIVNATASSYMSVNGNWRYRVQDGSHVTLGAGGVELTVLDSNTLRSNVGFTLATDKAIFFKGWNDWQHVIHHSAPDDGFRYLSWNYHRWWCWGVERFRVESDRGILIYSPGWVRVHGSEGIYFENRATGWHSGASGIIHNYNEGKLRCHKNVWMNSGGWGSAPESESAGNQDVGFSWHMPGWRAAIMWLGTDNIFRLQNDNGAWPRFDADHNDISIPQSKRDVRELDEDVLPKLRKLRPIKYKRRPDPAARALWEEQVEEGRWAPEAVAQVRRMDEEEHVGFMADNMAEVFPEVASMNPGTGKYDGIRYRLLVAPLVKAVIELEDRLLALEGGKK